MEILEFLNCCKSANTEKSEVDSPDSPKDTPTTPIIEQQLPATNNEDVKSTNNTNNQLLSNGMQESQPKTELMVKNDIITRKSESYVSFSNIKVQESEQSAQIFDTEIVSTHEIQLTGEIFWNKEIVIDKFGLKMAKRKNKSGTTNFGIIQQYNDKNEPMVDFLLNFDTLVKPEIDYNDIIFEITFDRENDCYMFRVLSKIVKILNLIDYEFFFPDNSIQNFLIGKVMVEIRTIDIQNINNKSEEAESSNNNSNKNDSIVNMIVNSSSRCGRNKSPKKSQSKSSRRRYDGENNKKILVKVYIEDKWVDYEFTKFDMPVTIGRKNSTISIKNNSISKNHCIINYDTRYQQFYMKDLDSTNGTFFQMEENSMIEISKLKIFKVFESKFTINEVF